VRVNKDLVWFRDILISIDESNDDIRLRVERLLQTMKRCLINGVDPFPI
jgi:hypothetical protein